MNSINAASNPAGRYDRLPVRFLLAVTLVATATLAVVEYLRQDRDERQRDEELAAVVAGAIEDSVDGTLAASATATALVDDDGTIPADRFERFARAVVDQPGVLSVAWERFVPAEDLPSFEAGLGTAVWERSEQGDPAPLGQREAYLPVVDAWPEQYSDIVGFDLLSEPRRLESVERARDLGRPVVTPPLTLAPTQRSGVLVVVPLYTPGLPIDTVADRRQAFSGAVTVGHFANAFLANLVRQPGMRIRVTDGGEVLEQTSPPLAAEEGAATTAEVGGRTWTLQVRHPERASLGNVLWILALGIGLTLAIAWSQRQTTRHVDQLAAAHDQLSGMLSAIQQGSLRAPAKALAGVEIAVRYRPAAAHAHLGGDWYDVLEADHGRLVITVGDVSGHGIEAITHMQQVRQVVSSFAFEGHAPAKVLRLANDVLRHEPMVSGHFATVWLGYLDRTRRSLRYASAGHPPPLLSPAAGEAAALDGAPGPPLNLPVDGHGWEDHEVGVQPGSALLVYTDGLVESRTHGFDAGVSLARTLIAEHEQPLDDLADRLMQARPDPGRDDAAFILARIQSRQPNPDGDGGGELTSHATSAPQPSAADHRAATPAEP